MEKLSATSKSVLYSTPALALLILILGAIATRALIAEIGKESEKTIAAIAELRERIPEEPTGSSAPVVAKQAAAGQRALELGGKALEAGQPDEALLYFINGMNHDPSRMELVRGLADSALKSGSIELTERALGILELATFQVAPDDVSAVLDRMAELRATSAPLPIPKLSPEEAAEEFEEMPDTYHPDTIWENENKIAEGLSEIDFFLRIIEVSRLDFDADRFSAIIGEADALARSLRQIQEGLHFYRHLAACVAEMDAMVREDSPDAARFASVSASAQGTLSQIWGGLAPLPKAMQDGFRSFPARMSEIEEQFRDKISTPHYDHALASIETAASDDSGNFTTRIQRISDALDEAAREGEKIASGEKRGRLLKEIRNARDLLMKLEIDRRAAYQRWSLIRLNGFMLDWNNLAITRKNSSRAKQFFRKQEIARIDESLLVPEAGRIFGRVISIMIGQLNAVEGSEIEYRMAVTGKKKLEEF